MDLNYNGENMECNPRIHPLASMERKKPYFYENKNPL